MKKIVILFSIICSSSAYSSSLPRKETLCNGQVVTDISSNGHIQGNGGDLVRQDFKKIADFFKGVLRDANSKSELADQILATEATVIVTDDVLKLNGLEKDALNCPSLKMIVVNRSRWQALSRKDKVQLAIHEYLGVIGASDPSYAVSLMFMHMLYRCGNQDLYKTFMTAAKDIALDECKSGYAQLELGSEVASVDTGDIFYIMRVRCENSSEFVTYQLMAPFHTLCSKVSGTKIKFLPVP